MASNTLLSHSAKSVTWKTPNPRMGISISLFNLTFCMAYLSLKCKGVRIFSPECIQVADLSTNIPDVALETETLLNG